MQLLHGVGGLEVLQQGCQAGASSTDILLVSQLLAWLSRDPVAMRMGVLSRRDVAMMIAMWGLQDTATMRVRSLPSMWSSMAQGCLVCLCFSTAPQTCYPSLHSERTISRLYACQRYKECGGRQPPLLVATFHAGIQRRRRFARAPHRCTWLETHSRQNANVPTNVSRQVDLSARPAD